MPVNDSIDRAAKDTRLLIMKSEFQGNYEELGKWVADYHGEAEDQQIMIDFGAWAIRNENEFKLVIHRQTHYRTVLCGDSDRESEKGNHHPRQDRLHLYA